MARIVVCAIGTTGDVLPMLALAGGLRRQGHRVTVAVNPFFLSLARAAGLDARPCGPCFGPKEGRCSVTGGTGVDGFATSVKMRAQVAGLARQYKDLLAAAEGADLLVSSSLRHASVVVQRTMRIPWAVVSLHPAQYDLRAQGACLPPVPLAGAELLAFSPSFVSLDPEVHPGKRPSGFLFFDAAETPEGALAPDGSEFLEQDRPLLVLSLGCSTWVRPGRLIRLATVAAADLGCRLVVQHGWTLLDREDRSWLQTQSHVRLAGMLPHDGLFARATAVIHAGGIGLCAQTLRHGLPSLVLPHRLDQYVTARCILRTATGAALDPSKVCAGALARILAGKVLAPECCAAAQRMAKRLRGEDGLTAACAGIERLLERVRKRRSRPAPARAPRFDAAVVRSFGALQSETSLSIIVPCMGRLHHLKRTIRPALAQPGCEYILVDWSCPDRSGDWVEAHFPQARVVRVRSRERFHPSAARNAGARVARTEWLAFLDVDLILNARSVPLGRRAMQVGSYVVYPECCPGYAGILICRAVDFRIAGRYDETLTGYGMEDVDLANRLSWLGLWESHLDPSFALHIRHGNRQRGRFFSENMRQSQVRNVALVKAKIRDMSWL